MADDDDAFDDFVDDDELVADEDDDSPDWNWGLISIPIIAVVTFIVVLLYGANTLEVADLGDDAELWHVVLAGAIVLGILLIVELVLLMSRHPDNLEDEPEPEPEPPVTAARDDEESPDLEALETDDEVEGRKVLEVARPPKWAVDAGVYATTYVEVDNARVLRLEEIVALRP